MTKLNASCMLVVPLLEKESVCESAKSMWYLLVAELHLELCSLIGFYEMMETKVLTF